MGQGLLRGAVSIGLFVLLFARVAIGAEESIDWVDESARPDLVVSAPFWSEGMVAFCGDVSSRDKSVAVSAASAEWQAAYSLSESVVRPRVGRSLGGIPQVRLFELEQGLVDALRQQLEGKLSFRHHFEHQPSRLMLVMDDGREVRTPESYKVYACGEVAAPQVEGVLKALLLKRIEAIEKETPGQSLSKWQQEERVFIREMLERITR